MRVLMLLPMALVAAACSAAPEAGSSIRRSGKTSGATSSDSTATQRDDAPSTTEPPAPSSDTTDTATPAPAPSPAPTTTTPPATPPPPGSCGNPKCIAFLGTGACQATDTNGKSVVLGCDQGACACLTGGQQTTAFADNAVTAEDMKALFFANCSCL